MQTLDELRKKIKRIDPLIRIAEIAHDKERMKLGGIKRRVQDSQERMAVKQQEYYTWLDKVNQLRGSPSRQSLEEMERGLDTVKNQCFVIFKELHELRQQEKMQAAVVEGARKELEGKEKLKGRYAADFKRMLAKKEEQAIEELSNIRFGRRGAR